MKDLEQLQKENTELKNQLQASEETITYDITKKTVPIATELYI